MTALTYQEYKFEQDKVLREKRDESRRMANRVFNKGLFSALWWRNPFAYIVLARRDV